MAVEDSSHTNQFHMASPQRTADATDREIAMTPNNQSIDVGAASSETGIIYFCINSSAKCVGLFCTPKQIVILMRLLKAFTFCFLVLNICSEMMFLLFVAFMNADALFDGAGSARDNIIRINGMLLSMIAISIELDLELSRSHFPGFRPYIPRSFLLLFIAVISEAQVTLSNTDNNVDDYGIDDSMIQREIPGSAIVFDAVTSFILYVSFLLLYHVLDFQ